MAKTSTMGAAGTRLLRRRTGADALEDATTKPARATEPKRTSAGYKVTTIRFQLAQFSWLRQRALDRADESGARIDASEIVRELVDAAMKQDKGR